MEGDKIKFLINALDVLIYFHHNEYSNGENESYYGLEFYPNREGYCISDLITQKQIIKDNCFKHMRINCFNDVCVFLVDFFKDAASQDIDIRILRNGHKKSDGIESSSNYSGMIFYNGKGFVKNRQLNDGELDLLFEYLIKNVREK
ncbi:MAG: hypothetical protein LC112_11075 [Flavobacteriales bacterium]|nr:hypothetical protein [Flavobacteriales bacterium]